MSNNTLLKTCSVCGLQKPLSAFLELTGSEGTTYGNVCATCRKTHLEKEKKPKDLEGTTTSTSGKKIDSKARVAESIDHLQEKKIKEEAEIEEAEKIEQEEKEVSEKEEKTTFEKKKLEEFLQKRSFLSEKKPERTIKTTAEQQIERAQQQAQNVDTVEKQTQATKEDQEKTEIRLDVPFIDTQIAGKLKYSSERFKQGVSNQRFANFRNWIGEETAPGKVAREIDKAAKSNKETPENPEEFIEKNWSPKSRGGR